jgi:3',5'-cyclic AMP phosphodiesterase CpdA
MPRLFHISDLHFGAEDADALAWFAALVAVERPDAILVTGDLTYRARTREFDAATRYLKALATPLQIEPGNHDLPYFNPLARFVRPYARVRALERAVEQPLAIPGVLVAPLRTTARAQWRMNWAEGRVAEESLAVTEALLAAQPPGATALVTCHHPLADRPGTHTPGRTRGGLDALTRLANAGATAVLSGHTHDPFDTMHHTAAGPIRLIGAGTLSERVRTSPPSFNALTVEGGALGVEVRTH